MVRYWSDLLICTVFDSKTGEWKILIDGKIESELKLNKEPLAAEEAKPLWIGRDNCCGARYGDITVDEAMVFDKALSEAELKPLVDKGFDGIGTAVEVASKLVTKWVKIKTKY